MTEGLSVSLWYEALSSSLGVVVETNDVDLCKAKLYALRRAVNDPDLSALSIVVSPNVPNQVWIIKRKPNAPERE